MPAVVAALPAEIDMASQEAAYGKLYAALAAGASVVIADFSATSFCDCSSLSRLLAVQHDAASRNARLLVVIPPGSPVGRLARLVSLDTRVPVYSSLREAEDQVPEASIYKSPRKPRPGGCAIRRTPERDGSRPLGPQAESGGWRRRLGLPAIGAQPRSPWRFRQTATAPRYRCSWHTA